MPNDDHAELPTVIVEVDYWDLDTLLDWVYGLDISLEPVVVETERLQQALTERSADIYGKEESK